MGAAVKRKSRRTTGHKRRQVVGSKGGAKKQKQPSIASNSVPSIATARIVYLWSWGPIVGPVNGLRSIKLAGTPIMAEDGTLNYPGVKWQFRSGELNQERLQGVSESSNEIDVGQELKSTVPWIHTVSRDMVDAVRLRFSWPQLQSQDSSGNINGVRIQYAVDVSTDGSPYLQALASEVDRKNITKYERSHRIELPVGSRWSIRARRLTPEANNSLVSDGMLIEAIAEVVDSDQEYPLTAVGCLEYDAQQFGGDIAKVAALMRGRIVRVPMNYDPATRTYATAGPGTSNGVWDGTYKEAYTNNPAWIFYDLALHPYYGLGERIDASMINRWALYRIAQYCDQMVPNGRGGQEPRFTCNLYLQKQAEGWAVLQDLAAIFHGLAYWDGSQIVVNADMPQDSAYTYSGAQILGDGAIKYSGSKWRDRHSLAMVSFDDPDQGFETDKEPVFDEEAMADYGVREVSVEAVGCTSRGQAQRAGQWALLTEQMQLRGATMRVGLDGYIPKPGKVISVADPMLAGRANGGRIAAAAGRVITLDRDVEVPTGARLQVNLPSGKAEVRQVRSVSGRKITVMADYSEVPEAECGWALDYDDLKLMQFYVRNVTRPEWHQFQLELIQHEPSKFDAIDFGTVIDDRPISVLPPGVQDAPARVLITSHNAVDQGISLTTMTIGWDAAPGAVAYDVEWRWAARDWIKLPRTGELSADVPRVYSGQYLARVRAISAMDVASMPTSSMLTNVTGKTTAPPSVTHLTTTALVYGIGLAWGFPAGAEDTQRTEIWYSKTNARESAIKLGDLAHPQKDHTLQLGAAGLQFFFWARLVDRSGNVGPWYPTGAGVSGASSSKQSEYEEYFKDKISNGALYPALREEISLISGPPTQAGSVAQRLAAEATARAQAIAAEATARSQAIAAEAVNRNKAIAAEALERTKAIDAEAAARAQGLLSEAQARGAAITSEAQARQSADTALSQKIDTVTASTGSNAAAIQAEITARTNADSALGQSIETVAAGTAANSAAIGNEITARTNADAALASQIATIRAESGGFDSALNYGFASTTEGWYSARSTLTIENGRMIVTNDSAGAYLNAPLVSINGRDHDRIRCRITRRAGTGWTGQVTYTTANHPSSAAHNKIIPNPGLAVGQTMVLEWDMSQLTNGGSDWSDSTITRFYLWLSATVGDVFEIDWIAVGQIAPSASVASVVDERTARISGDEANASAIIGLNSNLQTTNGNVTTAQLAAQAASDKAGAKGEVIYGTAAPSADKRLAQNLWIDTTGGANTPKRWSGSAWVAVTDKAATDAAAAAASALAQVATKADASALQSLGTTVSNQGNTLTSQGQSLTNLNNSLAVTNGNVTAAQQAADAANTLAGGKGKVIIQSAAPAVADRLVQNLWIDTTSNTNTPKRWSGSAWLAVTDKAATDAAAAAANALAVAQTKADASALQALNTTVSNQGDTLTSQGQSLTNLNNSLQTTNGNVTTAQQAAQAASDKAGAKGEVIYGTATPATDKRLAQNLWIDSTGGANTPKRWSGSAWMAVTDKVATDAAAAAQSALAQVASKADASALQALQSTVTNQGGALTSQGNALTQLQGSVGNIGGNGANLLSDEYSWLTSTTLPATSASSSVTRAGVIVPESDSGFGYQAAGFTTAGHFLMFSPTNNSAGYNVRIEPGTYLVSLYIRGSAAGSVRASFYDGSGRTSVSVAYTTTRTRITLPITVTDSTRAGVTLYPNMTAVADLSLVIDSVMVERRVGESNVPSPFVPGPSARATGGLASATQALDARVTQAESGLSSASSSINNLQNSLTTTNQNVTAAQQAAQDAATLAGGKGKVLVQSAAPAVADRLVQNLWIDTTGNANTPKRWSGSAWMAVTDKAATDAAAAAANALAVAQTKADASALQALSTTVTNQGGTLSSQGASITELGNGLQTTNGNVTTAQQAAQAASDKAGAKGEVIYGNSAPATDKRLAQNLWIDTTGGANTPKRWTGSAWVAVTDKAATDAAAAAAAALAQVATKADASALQALQSSVTSQGGTLASQGTSITQIKASIGQQPDNLVKRGSFEDGLVEPWTTSGSPATTVTGVTAHPSAGKGIVFYANSFCGLDFNILTASGEQFDLSADIYRGYMTAGQTGNFQMQFWDKAGANLGYISAFSFSAGGSFQTFSGRVTAPPGAVSARFVTRLQTVDGVGRSVWCNIAARRVTAAEAANAQAVSSLGGTVTQQGTQLTSQGQALTQLGNRVTDAEGVNSAQATAISQMDTEVKQQGEEITVHASRLDGLYVQVNQEMEGDASGMAGETGSFVGVWTEQSARVEAGIAMGKRVDTVQSQVGGVEGSVQAVNASVQMVSETVANVDGRVSAISSWKTETNANGKKVATGIVQGSDGEVGEILLMAQRLAIVDGLDGQMILPFVVQNGQVFINQAVINQAFIQEIVAGMTIRSAALNSQGLPLLEINFAAGTFALRGQDANGSTLLNNGGLYVYDANGIERTAVGRLT